jgi:hypothetical protein
MTIRVIALLCWFVMGCAKDLHASMVTPDPESPTGTLVLLFSQPATDVTVAVNGVLVAEAPKTRRIQIDGIPVGTTDVVLVANGADRSFRLWIGGETAVTMPLGIPDQSTGFLKTLLGSLITIVVYSLLH